MGIGYDNRFQRGERVGDWWVLFPGGFGLDGSSLRRGGVAAGKVSLGMTERTLSAPLPLAHAVFDRNRWIVDNDMSLDSFVLRFLFPSSASVRSIWV